MVALYILLGLIALIILIFCIKITFELIYDETFSFAIKILFITINIYPENDLERFKKKKKEEPPAEDKPKDEKPKEEKPAEEPKENFVQRFYRVQGFDGVVEFLKDILRALNGFFGYVIKKAFVIEKLFLQMYVASGDAAEAAIDYGRTCAAVFPALGYICSTMKVRKYDADINVDYLAKKSTAMINTAVSVRPIRLTNAVVVLGVRSLIAYLRARRREKKKQVQMAQETVNSGGVNI